MNSVYMLSRHVRTHIQYIKMYKYTFLKSESNTRINKNDQFVQNNTYQETYCENYPHACTYVFFL